MDPTVLVALIGTARQTLDALITQASLQRGELTDEQKGRLEATLDGVISIQMPKPGSQEEAVMLNQIANFWMIYLLFAIPTDLAVSVVEQLIENYLNDNGYRISDEQVMETVRETPEFQLEGRFDIETYRTFLAERGIDPMRYEELQRQRMRQQQLV